MENVEKIRREWKIGDDKRDAGLTTPEDIQRYDDISYGPYGIDNLLDVYVPKGTDKPIPAIISVHGGGWVYGDKNLYQHYCMSLAQRGFAVVNFTYRLAPENKYPAGLTDCFAVFKWVMEHGKEYFIDTNNLFMVGDSAGAQMTHQCCAIITNEKYASLFDFEVPEGLKINACALNCGIYVFGVSRLFKPNDMTMMADYLPQDYKPLLPQFKVIKNTTKDFPPAFVMTAQEDMLKLMAPPLYRHLQKVGVESEYHIYGEKGNKEVGHVFHVNVKLAEGQKCNDDECEFFRRHIV